MNQDKQTEKVDSIVAPLRRPVYRALWMALAVSGLGSWMHDVGAGWLMTSLAPDPVMVALVQAAVTLPVFFLALPAGALADIVDRRAYLLTVISWLMGTAGLLGFLTLTGQTTAWSLLALTFAMGAGTAMAMPAFAALIPELVPRSELISAVTLNSIAFNATRALGPALAGVIVALSGSGVVFVVNAVSYAAVLWVIMRWQPTEPALSLPSERFTGAIRTGIRYARRSEALRVILFRGIAVFVSISAPMAFLPLVVRTELNAGPQVFGLLLGSVGAGAVCMGVMLPQLRNRFSADRVVSVGGLGIVLASLALAWIRNVPVLSLCMFILGSSWITAQSTLQASAQLSLPSWIRARGLAVYIASFMGIMAMGAAGWGQVASLTSISTALTMAAGLGLLGILITWPLSVQRYAEGDQSPAEPIPEPSVVIPIENDQGPVMVNIEYRVCEEHVKKFIKAMREVRKVRLRNGSSAWGIFQDTADKSRFVEVFMDESWLEHLRVHYRITMEDRKAIDQAMAYHNGDEPPKVTHLLSTRKLRTSSPGDGDLKAITEGGLKPATAED